MTKVSYVFPIIILHHHNLKAGLEITSLIIYKARWGLIPRIKSLKLLLLSYSSSKIVAIKYIN